MRSRFSALLILALAVALGGCAQIYGVRRVELPSSGAATSLKTSAVFYSLPRGVVTAEIGLSKTVTKPGDCASLPAESLKEFAKKLGFSPDNLTDTRTQIKLTSFTIASRAEPDPSQVFAVELDDKPLQNAFLELQLSEAGMLLSGKNEATSQVAQFVTQTFSTVVGLAVKAGFGSAEIQPGQANDKLAERCNKIATDIEDIRTRRRDLVSGRSSQVFQGLPKDTLELMLAQLQKEEDVFLANFTGAPTVTLGVARCEAIPPNRFDNNSQAQTPFSDPQTHPLFELFDSQGIKPTSRTPCQIPKVFEVASTTGTGKKVELVVDVVDDHYSKVVARTQRVPTGSTGYFYRVPGAAAASLQVDQEVKASAALVIPQFGVVTALAGPEDLKVAVQKTEALFYPNTGALQKFGGTTTAPDTTAVTAAAEGVGKLLDASAAERQKEEAAEDELAQLERRRKILEEQKKIRDLETALAGQQPEEDQP